MKRKLRQKQTWYGKLCVIHSFKLKLLYYLENHDIIHIFFEKKKNVTFKF